MPIVNWSTGKAVNTNKTRSNRVKSMMEQNETKPKKVIPIVKPTIANRFFNLFSNKTPLPEGSLKKTPMQGGMTNYNKRALGFLSERSPNVATMNLKKLASRRNRNTLRKALNNTRRRK